jgi:hypothetical protein
MKIIADTIEPIFSAKRFDEKMKKGGKHAF